jgi:large subunit ribosomal protein L32
MTPLPKRRLSTRRGGKRQAAIKLANPTGIKCGNCGAFIKPHIICPKCGYYQGKPIIIKREKIKSKAKTG